jgi:predicted ribosomally synthesized peptide with SipW-like signal peptide
MKKLGLLALALVLALGVLGVGFALWSQQLTITGTVNTGELKVGIVDTGTNDPPPNGIDSGSVLEGPIDEGYDKNVGAIESINGQPKFEKEGIQYYHDVTYEITNAYPCYTGTGFFQVTNGGTIPVKLETITVTGATPEVTYTFTGLTEGQQIEPCETVFGEIHFHVEQIAAENTNYTITIELDFWQWNESTWP